jgi:hypothetical protein
MKTQSEQELKPVEILDKRDGTVLVLLRKSIKKNAATKETKTELAKPEIWEADEKQIEMKSFPGIEKYIQLHFDELFGKENITLTNLEKIEKRLSALEEK